MTYTSHISLNFRQLNIIARALPKPNLTIDYPRKNNKVLVTTRYILATQPAQQLIDNFHKGLPRQIYQNLSKGGSPLHNNDRKYLQ